MGAIVIALDRRGPARGPGLADPQEADPRPRPPGRPRGRAQGGPAEGPEADARRHDRSISIMQNRINKLGVSEPEIRKQGTDQIVIQLAGVHDPAAAAKLIGKTAQLMLFDFENDLTGPSTDVERQPGRDAVALRAAHAGAEAGGEGRAGGVLPLPHEDVKVKSTKKRRSRRAAKPTHEARHEDASSTRSSRAGDTLKELLQAVRRQGAAGRRGAEGARAHDRRQLPGLDRLPRRERRLAERDRTTTSSSTSRAARRNPVPEMTGRDLVLSGTRADFGQSRRADRDCCSSRTTARTSSRRSRATRRSAARRSATSRASRATTRAILRAALRDRPRRAARVDAVHRLQAEPRRHPRARTRRSTSAAAARSARRRTSRSSSRPVRCRSRSSRSSAPTSRRRSARTR